MTLAIWLGGPSGCVQEVSTVASVEEASTVLVVGRAMSVISGDRGRRFEPEIRQMELMQHQTGRRYRVMVEGKDKVFAFFFLQESTASRGCKFTKGPFSRSLSYPPPLRWDMILSPMSGTGVSALIHRDMDAWCSSQWLMKMPPGDRWSAQFGSSIPPSQRHPW